MAVRKLILLCFIYQILCSDTQGEKKKRKWKVLDIIGDLDHLKSDLGSLFNFGQFFQITPEDSAFYFHKMHDYDGNKKLDGIELIQSYSHFFTHSSSHEGDVSEDNLTEFIDAFLVFDENYDGFLTYAEFKKRWSTLEKEPDQYSI